MINKPFFPVWCVITSWKCSEHQTLPHISSSDDVMNCRLPLQTLLSCTKTPLPALKWDTSVPLQSPSPSSDARSLPPSLFVSGYNRMEGWVTAAERRRRRVTGEDQRSKSSCQKVRAMRRPRYEREREEKSYRGFSFLCVFIYTVCIRVRPDGHQTASQRFTLSSQEESWMYTEWRGKAIF